MWDAPLHSWSTGTGGSEGLPGKEWAGRQGNGVGRREISLFLFEEWEPESEREDLMFGGIGGQREAVSRVKMTPFTKGSLQGVCTLFDFCHLQMLSACRLDG